ncbi:porin, partial [Bradyrhizobium sp. UFLA 03-164]
NVPGAYQSIGFGIAPDSIFVTGGSQQLITTYGFRGAYVHNWNPNWNTSIYGAYAGVRYTDTAKGYICGPAGNGVGGSLS